MKGPGTHSPLDGSALPAIEWTEREQVEHVIDRAHAAQTQWAQTPFKVRAQRVQELARRILERRDEAAQVMAMETGRAEAESLLNEVVTVLDYANGAIAVAKRALQSEKVSLSPLNFPGKRAVIEAIPRGVIAIIEPWNYPLMQFYKPLFPALLAGNGVVLKPSEHTPRTGAWLAAQCDAVFGPGLVGVVQGAGEIGGALVDGDVDAVVFCGSVQTGRKVAARCGERLIPCSVELGGKDAALVLADCDLDRTVAGILQWSLNNAGQDCSSIERIVVEQAIADEFVSRLAGAVGKLTVHPEGSGDLGPLQNSAQLQRVEAQVEAAVEDGATLVVGGTRVGPGLGFAPTVLDHCTGPMAIMRDETFGPVLCIQRVDSAEQGVRAANDCEYGLGASVWTTDLRRGEQLARQLNAGLCYVNNHAFLGTVAQVPWTGVGATGTGTAGSVHCYPVFVRRRTVLVDRSSKPDVFWRPANADLGVLAHASAKLSLGAVGQVFTLLPLLGRRVRAIRDFVSGER